MFICPFCPSFHASQIFYPATFLYSPHPAQIFLSSFSSLHPSGPSAFLISCRYAPQIFLFLLCPSYFSFSPPTYHSSFFPSSPSLLSVCNSPRRRQSALIRPFLTSSSRYFIHLSQTYRRSGVSPWNEGSESDDAVKLEAGFVKLTPIHRAEMLECDVLELVGTKSFKDATKETFALQLLVIWRKLEPSWRTSSHDNQAVNSLHVELGWCKCLNIR